MLTMTYLDGIDWAAAQQADQDLKTSWAEVSGSFSGTYRHGNLFDADPRPGNYRFGTDGTVGFLDFGCVKVLPELQRRRMVGSPAPHGGRKTDLRDHPRPEGLPHPDPS